MIEGIPQQFEFEAIQMLIDSVLTDRVLIGSKSYDIENLTERWTEIINLLRFLNSDAAGEILEYYGKQI
jgi:hypothetical protein